MLLIVCPFASVCVCVACLCVWLLFVCLFVFSLGLSADIRETRVAVSEASGDLGPELNNRMIFASTWADSLRFRIRDMACNPFFVVVRLQEPLRRLRNLVSVASSPSSIHCSLDPYLQQDDTELAPTAMPADQQLRPAFLAEAVAQSKSVVDLSASKMHVAITRHCKLKSQGIYAYLFWGCVGSNLCLGKVLGA